MMMQFIATHEIGTKPITVHVEGLNAEQALDLLNEQGRIFRLNNVAYDDTSNVTTLEFVPDRGGVEIMNEPGKVPPCQSK